MCLAMGPRTVAGGELAVAIRTDDAKAFASAMAAKPDVNELDAGGLSPLYHAVVARNPQVVGALLAAGAQPVVPGQSGDPLLAATINGDREIIASLLDKGADPAAGNPGSRPVDAAVASGRVEVLRQLLRAKPDGKLPQSLIYEGSPLEALTATLLARHPAMTAELVSRLAAKPEPKVLDALLAHATGYEPSPALELIQVLRKAGADPLADKSDVPGPGGRLTPTSAAEVAAAKGRAGLLDQDLAGERRLLPFAANRIYMFALRSGDPATLEVVRKRLPTAGPVAPVMPEGWHDELVGPEEDPRTSWDTLRAGEIALRTKGQPPTPRRNAGGTATVAVLAGKDCDNEGDLLAAELSATGERWQVVERKEVGTLLAERDFDFAKPRGLVEIGDKLRAALLVLLSKPGKGEERVMRAEVVDVSTGMVVRRIHLATASEAPKAWTDRVVGALSRAADEAATGSGLHHAITLLGVGTLPDMANQDSARTLVSAGLLAEVDATPGCVALTRTQMEPLVAERALGGEGSVWQAGWSLTAGLGAPAPERLELRLRLKNLANGREFDVSGQGPTAALRDLVRETWAKAVAKADLGKVPPARPGAGDSEGKELLAEARWRMAHKEYDSAARIADAAHFVGSPDTAVQAMRIQARILAIGYTGGLNASAGQMGWALSRLPDLVETVEIMNEQQGPSLDHQLATRRETLQNGGNPPPWGPALWFETLIGARSALPPIGLKPPQMAMIDQFDRGFEEWCRTTFARLQTCGKAGYMTLPPGQVMDDLLVVDPRWCPWLPELMADYVVATCSAGSGFIMLEQLIENFELCQERSCHYNRKVLGKDISGRILAKLAALGKGGADRLACETAFLTASDQRRGELAHQVADLRAKALFEPGGCAVILFPNSLLTRYRVQSPSRAYYSIMPDHEDSLCGGVLPPPRAVGEVFRDFELYQAWLGRPTDRAGLLTALSRATTALADRERRPGITRLRSRLQIAARLAPLTDEELANLVRRLPEDRPRSTGGR